MIMVWHKNEGMNFPPGPLTSLAQTTQKVSSVFLILEYSFPAVPAGYDVVDRTCIFNSGFPSDGPTLYVFQ
jgi:hypothetical protein